MYKLDIKDKKPLCMQLYLQLREDILANKKLGDKMPSIRKLAELHNISKTTVETAYSQLYAEGLIDSKPKSGYYVSDCSIAIKKTPTQSQSSKLKEKHYRYDFFPAKLCSSDFPLKIWKRLQNKVVDKIDFGSYSNGQGNLLLREEIAKYLQEFRGVQCSSSDIIITHGLNDSLSLIAKLLKNHYQNIGIELPGYYIPRKIFSEYNYYIKDITLDSKGASLKSIKKQKPNLLYITPSHQYPTGIIMPLGRRLEILDYMQSQGGIIIEDDYDSELKYTSRPIPSLQGLGKESVVYLGTFAKVLSPAIRVGYMVVPKFIQELFAKSYEASFSSVNEITQLTLAKFLQEGYFERHLRKIRNINKKKHNLLLELLEQYLSHYEIKASGGGLAILIMPTAPFDFEKFKILAKQKSIKLYFTKEKSGGNFEAIRLGFGGFEIEELTEAIEALSEIWDQSFW